MTNLTYFLVYSFFKTLQFYDNIEIYDSQMFHLVLSA